MFLGSSPRSTAAAWIKIEDDVARETMVVPSARGRMGRGRGGGCMSSCHSRGKREREMIG